ncbi:hypothetical protein [Streptomyces sp. NPDC000983]|uniref:hypothetical protein n=1 Tax=Streptomyces sp. NPDC000983 TaxID=3154373 RepID=UPI00331BC536
MSTLYGAISVLRSLRGGGTPTRRRRGEEHLMPRRLRQDLDRALALPDGAARRTAVDRVVRGITAGAYGPGFRRRAADPG